jgi:hypothetical protein
MNLGRREVRPDETQIAWSMPLGTIEDTGPSTSHARPIPHTAGPRIQLSAILP